MFYPAHFVLFPPPPLIILSSSHYTLSFLLNPLLHSWPRWHSLLKLQVRAWDKAPQVNRYCWLRWEKYLNVLLKPTVKLTKVIDNRKITKLIASIDMLWSRPCCVTYVKHLSQMSDASLQRHPEPKKATTTLTWAGQRMMIHAESHIGNICPAVAKKKHNGIQNGKHSLQISLARTISPSISS